MAQMRYNYNDTTVTTIFFLFFGKAHVYLSINMQYPFSFEFDYIRYLQSNGHSLDIGNKQKQLHPTIKVLNGRKLIPSHQHKVLTKIQIKEMYVRGYKPEIILQTINESRGEGGYVPLRIHTIRRYIREMKSEGSETYLHLLKDQMEYINLYLYKLQELNGIKTMLYDKIEYEGGLTSIPSKTLVVICKVLRDIIATQADLEQFVPYIQGMQAQAKANHSPEQLKMIEASIISTIPDPILKAKYEQIRLEEIKKAEEQSKKDPTDDLINLSEYTKDTDYV
jgi:hypothetical protein